jgi:hypothetical protein
VPRPGDCLKVKITDAATYDLTGHVLGEASTPRVRKRGERGPRGGYR